jgi:hypothetical protein
MSAVLRHLILCTPSDYCPPQPFLKRHLLKANFWGGGRKEEEDGGNSVDGWLVPHSLFINVMRVRHKRCTLRWNVENKCKTGSALRTCKYPEAQFLIVRPPALDTVHAISLMSLSQFAFSKFRFKNGLWGSGYKKELEGGNSVDGRPTSQLRYTTSQKLPTYIHSYPTPKCSLKLQHPHPPLTWKHKHKQQTSNNMDAEGGF